MHAKTKKMPDPDHRITIERNPARIVMTWNGQVIADSHQVSSIEERPV